MNSHSAVHHLAARMDMAHDGATHARAANFAKMPRATYKSTRSLQHYSPRERLCKKDLTTILFYHSQVLGHPCAHNMVGTTMDGHARQLRHAVAPLAGRPTSKVLAPILDEVMGVAELAGVVATTSGRVRRWHGRTGHPRPPRRYWLARE